VFLKLSGCNQFFSHGFWNCLFASSFKSFDVALAGGAFKCACKIDYSPCFNSKFPNFNKAAISRIMIPDE
jgi:hypothetical protein